MTVDEILETVRSLGLHSLGPALHGFRMHPKTYGVFASHIERSEALPGFSVQLILDPWMPVGLVLPVDHEGKPIPRPNTARGKDEGNAP